MNHPKKQASNRLEIAESATLIASAAGTVCAAVFNQAIFAAAPLTLALSLNFINRQRLQKQTQINNNNTNIALTQIEKQFRGDMEAVRTQIRRLPPSERVREVEESITRLNLFCGQINQKLQANVSAVNDPKIQQEFLILRRAIVRLRDTNNAQFVEFTNNLGQEIAKLQANLNQTAPVTVQPVELEAFKEELRKIQAKVGELERKNQQIIKPCLKYLVSRIKQLQKQIDNPEMVESLAQLVRQLETLAQELEAQNKSSQTQTLRRSLTKISENLNDRQAQSIQPQKVRGWE